MELNEKKDILKSLNEADLREKLLIPLFAKMGFIDPILHHHSNEKGKDIVLKEYDSKFKKISYLAVVVKAGDVNGSASGNSSYFTLLNQIKQSLNEPYKHIYELKEVLIDQVIVVISGKFLPTSLESIYGTLKSEKLDKAIREPIDINKLPGLIDEHFSEYWEEFENEKKSLVDQRNNLLNNLSKLSKVLFPDSKEQDLFLNKVSKSEFEIDLLPYKSLIKYVANIGYKKIYIDEIDEYYTDNTISNYYSDIKKHFFEIKDNAQKVLFDFNEVIEILKSILDEKNPEKLVELTEDLDSYVSSYGPRGFNFASRDVEYQEEFGYALKEYRTKKDLLLSEGLLDLYKLIVTTIRNETIQQLVSFYNEHAKEEKDIWLGISINFDLVKKEFLGLKYYKLKNTPKVLEGDKSRGSISREIEKFIIVNSSEIHIEIAINNFGFWKEEEYSNERKAENFLWHYERGFENKFLTLIGYDV